MKITLVMVTSVNGKISAGDNPNVRDWSSKEDAKLFFALKEKNKLLIMGSSTYEVAKKKMRHFPGRLRIVLTREPQRYQYEHISNKLEFTAEPPKKLIKRLEEKGYKKALLLGGGEINSLFFKAGLIDELILTSEPVLFGQGKNLMAENDFSVKLKLVKIEQLNPSGTLRLQYKVL